MSEAIKEPQEGQTNEFQQPLKGSSLSKDAWRRLKKNRMAVAGMVIVVIYAILAVSAPILPIHSYKKFYTDHQYLPPSLTKTAGQLLIEQKERYYEALAEKENRQMTQAEIADLNALREKVATETDVVDGKEIKIHDRRYPLGTDYLGRDMLARIIYGGQVSIAIGLIGTVLSVLLGVLVGAISGYVGGTTDYLLMRFVDIMYSLPYLLLVIIFMSLFGKNIFNLFIALSLVSWLTTARVVRGQIISLKNSEFVEAARSMGAPAWRIIFRHLVPNTLGVIIVYSSLRVPAFIMAESFLSFLGLGISAPFASWGTLVSDAVGGMNLYPWTLFFPALAMTVFLFAMNFLGDGLRDAFDPQSKNRL